MKAIIISEEFILVSSPKVCDTSSLGNTMMQIPKSLKKFGDANPPPFTQLNRGLLWWQCSVGTLLGSTIGWGCSAAHGCPLHGALPGGVRLTPLEF